MRLLVIGTGDDATAFRDRATQAGAELAQRFSVRVTHVVAEDGVGDQDARIVRARTAGIPVLGLADGDLLLAGDEAEAGGVAGAGAEGARAEAGMGIEAGTGRMGDVGGGEAGREVAASVSGEEAGAGAVVEVEAEGDEVVAETAGAEVAELAVESDPHRRVLSLVRPRAELVPEPTEVRPSDVFTDSALEAVLHFPSLRDGDGAAESGDEAPGVAAESCGCGEEGVEAAELPGADDGGESGVAVSVAGRGRAVGAAASVAWALLPLVSVGLLTPVAMGYAAYRLRSRVLSIATVCYTIAVGAAFALSATSPVRTGTHAAAGALLLACLGASWLGGTVHSFLIRRWVFGQRAR